MERDTSPWDRARFLAMRTAFREDWVPQGGIEDALLSDEANGHERSSGRSCSVVKVSETA